MASHTSTRAADAHPPLSAAPDVANTIQTTVTDVATRAHDQAQAVAHAAVDAIDQNRGTAARVLEHAAATIHDSATSLPGGERVTRFAQGAADEIDATAQYLRKHNPQEMFADVKQFIARHPGASIVGAAVVGLLVGRGFRK